MLKNYIKIAFRNIAKSKVYSFINIAGLAISISACILIALWIFDELNYDSFNKNADHIYRVYLDARINNKDMIAAISPTPMGEYLQKTMPEIKAYTRLWSFGKDPVIRIWNKTFYEKRFLYADSTFSDLFSLQFISGNPKTALSQPYSVVLTEKTAKKYFGDSNPMGKIINYDNETNYTVTGVVKEFPDASHFHFDLIGSLCSLSESTGQNWNGNNFYTYILVKDGADINSLERKINGAMEIILGSSLAKNGISFKQFEAMGNRYKYRLQPIKDIHLKSHADFELEPNGNMSYIYVFGAIAIAILLIACINFVNLSTARSEKRAREVGIRKTLGSNKYQVAGQFFIESIITSSIAIAISVMIVEFLMPLFNKIADKHIEYSLTSNEYLIPFILGFAIIIGIISGAYPALYLSSFEPAQVLKSELRKGSRKSVLRSGLVIFQFTVSLILIIGTITVYNQLRYMQTMNLGFDKEQLIVINHVKNIENNIASLKTELLANSNIASVSNCSVIPGSHLSLDSYNLAGKGQESLVSMNKFNSDDQFVKTYNIKMKTGRFFSSEHPSDSSAAVINESAARQLGIKDVNGKYLSQLGNNWQIVGIMKDFNFTSLHEKVYPIVIFAYKQNQCGDFLTIRIKPGGYLSTLSFIENTWKKYSNNEAPDYTFLDQNIEKMYLADQLTGNLAAIFSVLAIAIACLGLFGLATFIAEQKTKEIGIRKVLGATITEIVARMSKEFIRWILIANVIAWPLAYYFMNKWLQNFAYRINISVWAFIISGVSVLLIALVTICSIAIKAATANPIKSLKYE